MDNRNKQVFNWVVKQGTIVLLADKNKIHLEINKENNPACLLTRSDAEEVISILTNIASDIWENPDYTKGPYNGKLYRLDDKGKAYWDLEETRLFTGLHEGQDALELDFEGEPVMKLPVNLAVEVIQIMTHFSNKL